MVLFPKRLVLRWRIVRFWSLPFQGILAQLPVKFEASFVGFLYIEGILRILHAESANGFGKLITLFNFEAGALRYHGRNGNLLSKRLFVDVDHVFTAL